MATEQWTEQFGRLGEDLVAEWLRSQQYRILKTRWRCRLGELDVVAQTQDGTIALVEVKTRSLRNWDLDGLLAVSRTKQQKLTKTALLFMMQHPQWAECAYRFDIALVRCEPIGAGMREEAGILAMRQVDGYCLSLHTYLDGAFEA
jgi:putative endonuclease